MANSVAIKCVVTGEAARAPSLAPIHLELSTERISVRELIGRAVEEQVRDLLERQRAEANVVQLALARQYLTAREVAEQAESGRVRLPSSVKHQRVPTIDIAEETAKALRGFEAGAFRVLADGVELESLDNEIVLGKTSKIVFLRLRLLVGG